MGPGSGQPGRQRGTFGSSARHLEQLAVIIDSDLGTGDPQRVPERSLVRSEDWPAKVFF
jgi:hypothetical protein